MPVWKRNVGAGRGGVGCAATRRGARVTEKRGQAPSFLQNAETTSQSPVFTASPRGLKDTRGRATTNAACLQGRQRRLPLQRKQKAFRVGGRTRAGVNNPCYILSHAEGPENAERTRSTGKPRKNCITQSRKERKGRWREKQRGYRRVGAWRDKARRGTQRHEVSRGPGRAKFARRQRARAT